MEYDKGEISPGTRAAMYVAFHEIFLADLGLPKLTAKENLDMTEKVIEILRSNPNNDFSGFSSFGKLPAKSR